VCRLLNNHLLSLSEACTTFYPRKMSPVTLQQQKRNIQAPQNLWELRKTLV
jgi:hypothetical protein